MIAHVRQGCWSMFFGCQVFLASSSKEPISDNSDTHSSTPQQQNEAGGDGISATTILP
jgi:hypothetical protein